jgi:hypothetical protein
VPLVEENPVEGIRNNVFGTQTIAAAARRLGVRHFILLSTDKAVRPTSFMGATKRIAELICQAHASETSGTLFSTVRFGNVLGSPLIAGLLIVVFFVMLIIMLGHSFDNALVLMTPVIYVTASPAAIGGAQLLPEWAFYVLVMLHAGIFLFGWLRVFRG